MFVLQALRSYCYFFFQRRSIHALVTRIAILGQVVKMENAFVVKRELETGNTAEVRLVYFAHIPANSAQKQLTFYNEWNGTSFFIEQRVFLIWIRSMAFNSRLRPGSNANGIRNSNEREQWVFFICIRFGSCDWSATFDLGLSDAIMEKLAKAQVKRRTSHKPSRMLMRENKRFFSFAFLILSFAFDSAHVKYGVWPGPKQSREQVQLAFDSCLRSETDLRSLFSTQISVLG